MKIMLDDQTNLVHVEQQGSAYSGETWCGLDYVRFTPVGFDDRWVGSIVNDGHAATCVRCIGSRFR